MRAVFAALVLLASARVMPGPAVAQEGLVVHETAKPVADTLDAFEALVRERGLTVFARIDHAAGAADVALDLPANQVLIFGNPRLGTPLIQASPSIGLDMPIKVSAWRDGDVTRLAYLAPTVLAARHGIPEDHPSIVTMTNALATFAQAATAE